jgi:hypothetical protein
MYRNRPLAVLAGMGLACTLLLNTRCSSDGSGPVSSGPDETVASIVVTPATAELASLGQKVTLSATVRNTSGGVVAGRTFTWTSSNQAVAVVSPSGEVTSVSNGPATITATTGTVSGSAQIRVEQAVARVRIQPDSTTLAAPGTVRLEAEGADAMDNRVAGATFDWRSSDESVAVVDPTGVVAGVSPGRAVISATSQGVAAATVVRVVPRIEFATASADGHSCAMSSTGAGYCWGSNSWGELGAAVGPSSLVPVPVEGGYAFRSISPGVRVRRAKVTYSCRWKSCRGK